MRNSKFRGSFGYQKQGKSGNVRFPNRYHALASPDLVDEECFPSLSAAIPRAPTKVSRTDMKIGESSPSVMTSTGDYDRAEEGHRLEKLIVAALNRAKQGHSPLSQEEINHFQTWLANYRAANAQNQSQDSRLGGSNSDLHSEGIVVVSEAIKRGTVESGLLDKNQSRVANKIIELPLAQSVELGSGKGGEVVESGPDVVASEETESEYENTEASCEDQASIDDEANDAEEENPVAAVTGKRSASINAETSQISDLGKIDPSFVSAGSVSINNKTDLNTIKMVGAEMNQIGEKLQSPKHAFKVFDNMSQPFLEAKVASEVEGKVSGTEDIEVGVISVEVIKPEKESRAEDVGFSEVSEQVTKSENCGKKGSRVYIPKGLLLPQLLLSQTVV
ncbi:hypothetical protein U1Q18_031321 [Sarracenia purpurea var. burkii]